jgi:hypothetical protein
MLPVILAMQALYILSSHYKAKCPTRSKSHEFPRFERPNTASYYLLRTPRCAGYKHSKRATSTDTAFLRSYCSEYPVTKYFPHRFIYTAEYNNNNNNNHGSTALYGPRPPLASSFRGY